MWIHLSAIYFQKIIKQLLNSVLVGYEKLLRPTPAGPEYLRTLYVCNAHAYASNACQFTVVILVSHLVNTFVQFVLKAVLSLRRWLLFTGVVAAHSRTHEVPDQIQPTKSKRLVTSQPRGGWIKNSEGQPKISIFVLFTQHKPKNDDNKSPKTVVSDQNRNNNIVRGMATKFTVHFILGSQFRPVFERKHDMVKEVTRSPPRLNGWWRGYSYR